MEKRQNSKFQKMLFVNSVEGQVNINNLYEVLNFATYKKYLLGDIDGRL